MGAKPEQNGTPGPEASVPPQSREAGRSQPEKAETPPPAEPAKPAPGEIKKLEINGAGEPG
jgi:hypothetical protein